MVWKNYSILMKLVAIIWFTMYSPLSLFTTLASYSCPLVKMLMVLKNNCIQERLVATP